MGRERRKWTPQEDQVLREAVEQGQCSFNPSVLSLTKHFLINAQRIVLLARWSGRL